MSRDRCTIPCNDRMRVVPRSLQTIRDRGRLTASRGGYVDVNHSSGHPHPSAAVERASEGYPS